jgi:hypothetical protein
VSYELGFESQKTPFFFVVAVYLPLKANYLLPTWIVTIWCGFQPTSGQSTDGLDF